MSKTLMHRAARLVTAAAMAAVMVLSAPGVRPSRAQDDDTVVVGTEHSYPPYSFLDENDRPTGFNVDLTRAIGEAAGLDVSIDYRPWGELRADLEAGRIDAIAGMVHSEARDELVDFSPPYAAVHHAAFARQGTPAIEDEEALRGQALIVMAGDIMHDYVLERGLSDSPVVVEDQAEALQLLASGQHDYALVAKLPGLYWIEELGLESVVVAGPPLLSSKYCYAVQEGDSELLFRLSEGLALVRESGRYRAIESAWLGALEPRAVPTRTIVIYGALGLGALLVVLAGVGLWTLSLRRRVERRTEALRESEERLQLAMDAGEHGFWDWDLDSDEIFFSPRYYTMLGYEPGELPMVKATWVDLMHPEDRETVLPEIEEHVANAEPYARDFRMRCKDGSWRWISGRGKVYEQDQDGVPHRAVGVYVDITERKEAEEALRRVMKELERSNRELEQFAYVASHDLQEPLRMVASYTQLLGRRYAGQLDDDADDFIAYAVDGANRMQRLINDLLSYSRVTTRGQPFAPTDCNAVLAQVRANLDAAIRESGALVTHDDLPTVMADQSQMVQLFQNLIGNAIKFRKPDEPPRVHVSAEESAAGWRFSVRDNGIGIDPRYHEQIFLIFERLHGRGEYPGTGIGLATCQRIVERHGGRIWVASEEGRGAVFQFTVSSYQ
jgi:PAS domain S-box-containing protein